MMDGTISKAVFVLCEGPHDAAFLYRILKTAGYKAYTKKIKDFPPPIDQFIIESVKKTGIAEMNLDQIRKSPLPQEVLCYKDILILIYCTGGDSKHKIREKMITNIANLLPEDEKGFNPAQEGPLQLAVCYFMDADRKGIDTRLREIEKELSGFLSLNREIIGFAKNGGLITLKGIHFGAYIFAGENRTGKLEDILFDIMKENNEAEFEKAAQFLQLHDKNRLYKVKIKNTNGTISEKRSLSGKDRMVYDPVKSVINIAGQLQNSGKANTVIIKDCDYIRLEKIKNSSYCRQIIEFFRTLENME